MKPFWSVVELSKIARTGARLELVASAVDDEGTGVGTGENTVEVPAEPIAIGEMDEDEGAVGEGDAWAAQALITNAKSVNINGERFMRHLTFRLIILCEAGESNGYHPRLWK